MLSTEMYMLRCLDLARLGIGKARPNPLVGCVIVHQNKIIGEGWHKRYGDWHAEVNAIESVRDKALLAESEFFINLEPCSHFGKTPPCANLLAQIRPKKVFIANIDSNPLVAGKGIAILQQAGIEVETGILAKEGYQLNCRFFTFMQAQRPYIILKWAETADGFIAGENYQPISVSNALSHQRVHQYRAEEHAIWIGKNTALFDNPQLNVRLWVGQNPVRIVIDNELTLPKNLHIWNENAPTICFNTKFNKQERNITWVKIDHTPHYLSHCLQYLYQQNIQSVLVEGGAKLLNSFIEQDLYDEIRIFKSPKVIGRGIKAPTLPYLPHFQIEKIQEDTLYILRKEQP
ncbi:MAG: bifunctional diaminohydroxyphosphoribosylaminopyrimidine deaminase/5-amino-6-(5-phosphoribosylamino)uracil reductase RibD [Microscillaceae bacterium]|nr:bifunctional diaminohydroxyphosphoribosylaminopyrimidine deaminase/5-amino-6-(5-phosphoribosylamino)uracil reductase RibD [Microscillaceae bacterium]MDW8461148.1 bifunctional diaminohydroxyphosphoribosylaminopyrimidine deaminase/5-amino-6-(5-phosphoribosylamino)uracil reductase RibD [Cytophagales bacterium]